MLVLKKFWRRIKSEKRLKIINQKLKIENNKLEIIKFTGRKYLYSYRYDLITSNCVLI